MYKKAKLHFKKNDPVLYRASLLHDIKNVTRSRNIFKDLVRAIASQQLSGKAADTIFGRLEKLVGKDHFTPEKVYKINMSALRACGFSNTKVVAIKDLTKSVLDRRIDLNHVHEFRDDEIYRILTSVKGVGPWTVEMILMFSLGREDIFSVGDLGLRKGIMYLYGLKSMPSDKRIISLSKSWKPYRTYAARILWRVADEKK